MKNTRVVFVVQNKQAEGVLFGGEFKHNEYGF